jgi:hypothetical protein
MSETSNRPIRPAAPETINLAMIGALRFVQPNETVSAEIRLSVIQLRSGYAPAVGAGAGAAAAGALRCALKCSSHRLPWARGLRHFSAVQVLYRGFGISPAFQSL